MCLHVLTKQHPTSRDCGTSECGNLARKVGDAEEGGRSCSGTERPEINETHGQSGARTRPNNPGPRVRMPDRNTVSRALLRHNRLPRSLMEEISPHRSGRGRFRTLIFVRTDHSPSRAETELRYLNPGVCNSLRIAHCEMVQPHR